MKLFLYLRRAWAATVRFVGGPYRWLCEWADECDPINSGPADGAHAAHGFTPEAK